MIAKHLQEAEHLIWAANNSHPFQYGTAKAWVISDWSSPRTGAIKLYFNDISCFTRKPALQDCSFYFLQFRNYYKAQKHSTQEYPI